MTSLFVLTFSCLTLGEDVEQRKKPGHVVITRETMKRREYELIPLGETPFGTVKAICSPWLSEKGILTHEQRRNSILVYDYPETIEKIRRFLRDVDTPAVNIRIDVDYLKSGRDDDFGVKVETGDGRGFGKPSIVVENGKIKPIENVRVSANMRRRTTSGMTSQFIVTQSGSPAKLWVGETIVDPSWLNNLILAPTVIVQGEGPPVIIPGTDVDFKWSDVGAALEVLPTYLGNGLIDVEVYPRVSYLDGKGKKQAVKVESVSTHVTVRDGQRFSIGGLIESKKDDMIKLFGPNFLRREDGRSVLDIYLTARALTPSGRSLNAPKGDRGFRRGENPWRF